MIRQPVHFPTKPVFPPETFPIVERHRTTPDACASLIIEVQQALNIGGNHLARLLGADTSQIWAVKRGDRRFGTAYMARLVKLLLLHLDGIPLYMAHSIYWKEGIINWRNGVQTEATNLLDTGLTEEEPRKGLTQWGGQTGPRPWRKSYPAPP